MKHSPKNVVLIGAGHAHVEVMRTFGRQPVPGARLTLITRQLQTPYSGMLPGLIAGLYGYDAAHIDAMSLARFAQARLRHDEAIGLDLATKHVICRDLPPVPYDVLSMDIGSTPSTREVPGAEEHAVPVKPVDSFMARFEEARVRILNRQGRARVGVVGGGAGGVELILSMQRRLIREVSHAGFDPSALTFTIITSTDELLPSFPKRMRKRFSEILTERKVRAIAGHSAASVHPKGVEVAGVGTIGLDEIFWTTQAAPAAWLADTGLALDREGFIRVGSTLQSVSHPDVFAAGDIAALEGHLLPKSGVYAVRAGPPLARNLRGIVEGTHLRPYKPQREALYLVSTGERYALGTRNGFTFEGAWVWWLKDFIDRRFMAKFKALEKTPTPN